MKQKAYGFTIIELLVVIVVIAILAAISVVAYTGVQNSAVEATMKSSLRDAVTRLGMEHTLNESYPATEEAMRVATGLEDGNSITYHYDAVAEGYCLSAISERSGIGSFHVTNLNGTPQENACSGHGPVAPSITNLVMNPSIETGTGSLGAPNGSIIARDTSRAHTGEASVQATMPTAAGSSFVGTMVYQRNPFAFHLNPNTTYTVSAYVYVPTGTVDVQLSIQGSGRGSTLAGSAHRTSVKNEWTRIHRSFTTNEAGSITIYVLNDAAIATAGTQFWVDSIMLTEGPDLHAYADGESDGWSWNDARHTSTSSGPAL